MNNTIRRVLTSNRWSRRVYCAARQSYRIHQVARGAKRYFLNVGEFKRALAAQGVTAPVDLLTVDGLTITIRQNFGDAMTVADIFIDDCYIQGFNLAPNPVVIDIGGFVGDFSLYAAKRLNARKVVVCEPSPRNWTLLLHNIANNHYEDRIFPVHKAVTDGHDVLMNVDAPDDAQCMVSAYYHTAQPLRSVPGISLMQLLSEHDIDTVDLLKIDCEGGEYAILDTTPSEVLRRVKNIVFEYQDIEGGWTKLEKAKQRLRAEGYTLHTHRGLVSAFRQ